MLIKSRYRAGVHRDAESLTTVFNVVVSTSVPIYRAGYLTGGRDTLPYRVTYVLVGCGVCPTAVSLGTCKKCMNGLLFVMMLES